MNKNNSFSNRSSLALQHYNVVLDRQSEEMIIKYHKDHGKLGELINRGEINANEYSLNISSIFLIMVMLAVVTSIIIG